MRNQRKAKCPIFVLDWRVLCGRGPVVGYRGYLQATPGTERLSCPWSQALLQSRVHYAYLANYRLLLSYLLRVGCPSCTLVVSPQSLIHPFPLTPTRRASTAKPFARHKTALGEEVQVYTRVLQLNDPNHKYEAVKS